MTENPNNNLPDGEIRNEEDTTNIRRVGAKDRKKRVKMTGALFPDEPGNETAVPDAAQTSAPDQIPTTPNTPTVNIQRDAGIRGNPARPATKPRTVSKKPGRKRSPNALLYNFVTLLFVLATLAALAYLVFLWGNFDSPLNPFAPPTPLPIYVTATPSF